MKNVVVSSWYSITTMTFLLLLVESQLGEKIQDKNCSKNATSWAQLKDYPKLEKFLESKLSEEGLTDGGHSLIFVNWKDIQFRVPCPEKDENKKYAWKQICYDEDSLDEGSECKEFNEAYDDYSNYRLMIPSPKRCGIHEKRFRTYLCETETNGCKHYIHSFIRPLPKTKFPNQITIGESIQFDCQVFPCKKDETNDEYEPILGPFTISWRGPDGTILDRDRAPSNVNISLELGKRQLSNGTVVTTETSTIQINDIDIENNGFYECILTSTTFGLTSSPDDGHYLNGTHQVTDVNLKSGMRFPGFVHVNSRPMWTVFIPLGIIGILCLILPLLIIFCPTREDEADIDQDDEEEEARLAKSQRKSSSVGLTTDEEGSKNNDK